MDTKKILKGLEICINNNLSCEDCPYNTGDILCIKQLCSDSFELLKRQPVLCEDCRYSIPAMFSKGNVYCGLNKKVHVPNWFCADGKERE